MHTLYLFTISRFLIQGFMVSQEPKKQRSISSFFQPQREKPKIDEIPKAESPVKRKLSQFQHDEPKKPSPKVPKTAKPAKPTPTEKQSSKKLTPLEKQFIDLKTANPDKILAIQVGYKFKFFGQDAVEALQILNITLLPGNIPLDDRTYDRFAYCSIPDNRLHVHLQRLLNAGFKVAVVKQTETAAIKSVESKSGLFERQITGVYTKATYMGDELLTGDPGINRSNQIEDEFDNTSYIMCIDETNLKNTAIVAVQPLTGDIVYDTFADNHTRDELETRLAYMSPSEVLIIPGENSHSLKLVKLKSPNVSILFRKEKSMTEVQAEMSEFFDSLGELEHLSEYYQLNFPQNVQRCVNELILYLEEFRLSNIFTIPSNMTTLTDSRKYMLLPASTLRALDIFQVEDDPRARKGSLFWLLDNTCTRNGSRMLRRWVGQPLVQKEDIQARLQAVDSLRNGKFSHLLDVLRNTVAKVGKNGIDMDRLLIKAHYTAAYDSNKISRKEIYQLLKGFQDILDVFRSFGEKEIQELSSCTLLASLLQKIADMSKETFVDHFLGMINQNAAFDNNLNDQRKNFFKLHDARFDKITQEQEYLAIVDSKLDQELQSIRAYLKRPQLQYVTNLRDTHLVEVRNGKAVDSLPSDWIKISGTKTVSRFRPPEVSRLHKELVYHEDTLLRACDACFHEFIVDIDSKYEYLHEIVNHISTFDCLLSLAAVGGNDMTYVCPEIVENQTIDVKKGNHPILYSLQQSSYVPNDVDISQDKNRVLIITGPNMGGKSSYVKQVALLVIMCQVGSFLPCESAKMGVFDSIFIRMGASDNILRGKSTFMVEMMESANIIKNILPKALIILDEIGRGTGTNDGIALAYSILKYIIQDRRQPLTLFITHYPSLHLLAIEHSEVKNCHMAFIEKPRPGAQEGEWPEVIFLYQLAHGVVSNLYGLNVAKLAGVPLDIIENAYKMSESMKRQVETGKILDLLSQMSSENANNVLLELSGLI